VTERDLATQRDPAGQPATRRSPTELGIGGLPCSPARRPGYRTTRSTKWHLRRDEAGQRWRRRHAGPGRQSDRDEIDLATHYVVQDIHSVSYVLPALRLPPVPGPPDPRAPTQPREPDQPEPVYPNKEPDDPDAPHEPEPDDPLRLNVDPRRHLPRRAIISA